MTKRQRYVLGVVSAHHLRGLWYRAAGNGERVTLASLYRAGALKRRAWRGNEGEADAAHEYQLTEEAEQALRQALPETARLVTRRAVDQVLDNTGPGGPQGQKPEAGK